MSELMRQCRVTFVLKDPCLTYVSSKELNKLCFLALTTFLFIFSIFSNNNELKCTPNHTKCQNILGAQWLSIFHRAFGVAWTSETTLGVMQLLGLLRTKALLKPIIILIFNSLVQKSILV